MDIAEAIKERHSVRKYLNKPLTDEHRSLLLKKIEEINKESGLNIQLVCDEPRAFDCFLARYGRFSGVTNYFAFVGKKGKDLDELCGYYGEQLVLYAQMLGLNTCWAKMSYKLVPETIKICKGEKLNIVASVGYGENNGAEHKSKLPEQVSKDFKNAPQWFKNGVEAALLAPTAINQQNFKLDLRGDRVSLRMGIGPCVNIDKGIVKYHFEIGAGKENFVWEEGGR